MTKDYSVPFYLMDSKRRTNSDKWPDNKSEAIAGLEEAVRNTENKLSDYRKDGANTFELEFHLQVLKNKIESLRKNI